MTLIIISSQLMLGYAAINRRKIHQQQELIFNFNNHFCFYNIDIDID